MNGKVFCKEVKFPSTLVDWGKLFLKGLSIEQYKVIVLIHIQYIDANCVINIGFEGLKKKKKKKRGLRQKTGATSSMKPSQTTTQNRTILFSQLDIEMLEPVQTAFIQ